jgi:hypothetical protein
MTSLYIQFISAAAAAAIGFLFHVVTSEHVSRWITAHMKGRNITSSRNVILPAAITSLEMGIGLVIFYALIRDHLPVANLVLRGIIVGLLILAITGRLFRQPFMNWLVGCPIKVVLVQDGVIWLNWLLMSVSLVLVYEMLI